MQGDKFHQFHQKKRGWEKSLFLKIRCHATTIVTRDKRSAVWGFTKLPHREYVFFEGGRGCHKDCRSWSAFTHMPSRDVLFFRIAISAKNCMVWISVVRCSFLKNIFLDFYYSISLLYRCEKQKFSCVCKTLFSSKIIQIKFKRAICWSQWVNTCIELS